MRLGAHVPTRGSLTSMIGAARECGAESVQVFASNPRAWSPPRILDEAAEAFREAWRASGLGPLFVHAPYLVNIASPNPGFLLKSIELARRTLAACERIGADGLVVHAGSGGPDEPKAAVERAAASLRAIGGAGHRPCVVVELTAGTAGSVAATFAEAASLLDAADDDRLGICADTCHLFAAGYGLDEPARVAACFDELRGLGLDGRLALVHANDAMFERGSRRDRHEHIGRGRIGSDGFRAILADPTVRGCPVLVETPGGIPELRRDIETLRSLAQG